MKAKLDITHVAPKLSATWQANMDAIIERAAEGIIQEEVDKCDARIKARLAAALISVVARIERTPPQPGEYEERPRFNIILELGDAEVEA